MWELGTNRTATTNTGTKKKKKTYDLNILLYLTGYPPRDLLIQTIDNSQNLYFEINMYYLEVSNHIRFNHMGLFENRVPGYPHV